MPDDHYTSCYDMAQILRWALTQPGFETVFTRREMYTMEPTNIQPVTRYFSQQDAMRIGSSRYSVPSIQGSKIGYTNIARYSYVCLAEQNGVRLICVTMESQLKPDKYRDVKALLDYAFSTWTSYTPLGRRCRQRTADGRLAAAARWGRSRSSRRGCSCCWHRPDSPGCNGGAGASRTLSAGRTRPRSQQYTPCKGAQRSRPASIRLPAKIQGLEELLAQNVGTELLANKDLLPRGFPWGVLGTGLLAAVGAAALWLRVKARPRGRDRRRH